MDLYVHVGMFMRSKRHRIALRGKGSLMELYLQFGYGMMEHCRHLLGAWGGGTVVLSPRDLSDAQLRGLARDVTDLPGGRVLLDPQFYLPDADHERLCSHNYWPADYESGGFHQGSGLRELLTKLAELNDEIGTSEMIVPGILATEISDQWLERHRGFVEGALESARGRPVIATIALGADAARSQEQIASLLESATRWGAQSFYIVCEHPKGDYLVQDANWLANVLDLVAGLRLAGARVIVGYSNHQMLAAAAAGANALCSGTWMNVRSFPPDKFRSSYEEEIRQRATWYYCPQALSEYKIPFLDIAHRQGLLTRMAAPPDLDGGYARHLFDGPQPSSAGFTEQAAFRHYLHALRAQVLAATGATYDETRQRQEELLDNAEDLLRTLVAAGVRGQQRDFGEIVDVNRAALALIDSLRGPTLRRRWAQLHEV